jgi:penicillin-binding protein 1C
LGVPAFLDRLHALGFQHLQRAPDYYGLGLTLGAGEVTLWDLTRAYVTLARNGNAVPLRVIREGSRVPQASQIGSPRAWEYITDILADRYTRAGAFGVGSVVDMPFPAAVKTGTSSGYRDTWTVGYTPEYTVAVWAGNFNGSPMERVAGVSGAGPLWNRIMLHLYEHRNPQPFVRPASGFAVTATPARALHVARSSSAFDEWRIQQGDTAGALRILFPHDGDLFEDALSATDPQRSRQQIAFRISRPRDAAVRWMINGSTINRSAGDSYYWTVRPGVWTLTVTAARATQSAHFTVIPRRAHGKRGFAIVGAH